MPETATARQIFQGLLAGLAPARPLFLPIVFAPLAVIENLPLQAFLANPTKISNSLRRVRAHLHSDGVTCYFDPYLEADALGAILDWDAQGKALPPRWPPDVPPGESGSGRDPASGRRVAVAIEVIRRLQSIVRDDCLLTAAITGPLTLAAMLSQLDPKQTPRYAEWDSSAVDLAYAITAGIAKAFAEAGANVIFIREQILPEMSAEQCAEWAARLGTTVNIARFYQTLPVLLLGGLEAVRKNSDLIRRQSWSCLVCPVLGGMPEPARSAWGVALDPESLRGDAAALGDSLRKASPGVLPVITTTTDVDSAADVERLKELWENMR
jgi:hypothetical protein